MELIPNPHITSISPILFKERLCQFIITLRPPENELPGIGVDERSGKFNGLQKLKY